MTGYELDNWGVESSSPSREKIILFSMSSRLVSQLFIIKALSYAHGFGSHLQLVHSM
jgi:hypothetical protein